MLDRLISGGTVFDGRGSAPRRADVGIREGRIACIAPRIGEPAAVVENATGRWITPGFIDIHTHYDVEVEIAPGLSESVRHGVTTVVMGNCSLSLTVGEAQVLADIFLRVESMPAALVRKWLARSVSWKSPQEYLAHLGDLALGPNVAPMVGHSALRATAMGLERSLGERATDAELAAMRSLAERALDAGCIGISVDMVHWHKVAGTFAGRSVPSHYADLREYRMLADVCRSRDAVFQATPNPRNPLTFLAILWLSLGVFRAPLRATVLSALDMTDHPQLWRVFPVATLLVNRVLGGNLRFQTLAEPFAIYGDGPITPLFEEFDAGVELNTCRSAQDRHALWSDPAFRSRFRHDWLRHELRTFHRDPARILVVGSPDAAHVGRTIADIAAVGRCDPTETLMDLLAVHDDRLRWVACGANQRARIRQRLMAHPHILPGFTDAGAHSRNLAYFDGALALLRQAVSTGFMPAERAVARVTGEAARWFNLDAGVLRPGARADLVVLDPEALHQPVPEPVEIDDPLLDSARRMVKRGSERAVKAVLVAGVEVVRDGTPLPALGYERTGSVLGPLTHVGSARAALERYRNRIDERIMDHPFGDYWEVFVFKHQHPANVAMHCAAVLMMYAVAAGIVITGSLWWLLLVPASQLTGLAGHLLYERSHVDVRDVVFSWRASRCLNRMMVSVITRRYAPEVERVRGLFQRYEQGLL